MATRISVGGWPGGRRLPLPDFAPVGGTSRLLPSLSLRGCEKGDIVLGQACEIEPGTQPYESTRRRRRAQRKPLCLCVSVADLSSVSSRWLCELARRSGSR